MTKFYKVSEKEFEKGYEKIPAEFAKVPAEEAYKALTLPKRATKGSAGYDFVSPVDFFLYPGETILLPTGIRCEMKENQVLLLFPRSGMGFKYRLQLDNTIGVIDSDYFYSDNEGHIMAKITNDSNERKMIEVKAGEAFMQGVFVNYGITDDDDSTGIRNGGFGSTSQFLTTKVASLKRVNEDRND